MKTNFLYIIPVVILIFCAFPSSATSHDYVPGTVPDHPIMLTNGTIYTISNGILSETDIQFEDGIITAIGQNLPQPDNCEVIDITGKHVYPGLIAPNTSIGLVEIGAVSASVDRTELGPNNADVRSNIAYNPDSEIIPSVRANGITTVLVVPGGSVVKGRSALMNLDGWTQEDAIIKENVALHINWPSQSISSRPWIEMTPEEQKERNQKRAKQLDEIFETAHAYYLAKKAGTAQELDLRLDAMVPVFSGELPVFINASDYRQIDQALEFANKYNLHIVIVGGADSWKLTEQLKQDNIPVILSRVQANPSREDEPYDMRYELPALLARDSVKFCLSYGSYTGTRNLPFQAAQAVAFGLDKELALRALTLSTAEILGIEDELGSLEIGKRATLVVSNGDILDHLTHEIVLEFIDGKPVDLNNKHKELYEKYRQKTPQAVGIN